MKKNTFIPARWLGCAAIAFAVAAFAISPAQVQKLLDSGDKVTFVDVRLNTLFQKGHIPGAINIPAQLVPEKQLPPLGHVVVYDGGLGEDVASAAAAALNQKNGITAEVLDGGYAAWEMAQSATTKSGGVKPEETPLITYAELKKVQSADVVLVDLRKKTLDAAGTSAAKIEPPLTDLQAEFPNARIVHSPFAAAPPQAQALAAGGITPPLLVLIDNGDGSAQTMARALKANGVTRFVILAGGEQILAVHGQPGLQRIGSSVTVRSSSGSSPVTGQ
ncbi:MAG: rhodanese-like domain-containing protein [Limisphaerales bacterium]